MDAVTQIAVAAVVDLIVISGMGLYAIHRLKTTAKDSGRT